MAEEKTYEVSYEYRAHCVVRFRSTKTVEELNAEIDEALDLREAPGFCDPAYDVVDISNFEFDDSPHEVTDVEA